MIEGRCTTAPRWTSRPTTSTPTASPSRVRTDQGSWVRAATSAEADQRHQALPARHRHPPRIPVCRRCCPGKDPSAGSYRPAIRPDDQVRDRHQQPDRVDRGDPAPIHPGRDPPHLPGDAGGRPGTAHDLPVPLPAIPRPSNGKSTRAERRRVLERGQHPDRTTAKPATSPPTAATNRNDRPLPAHRPGRDGLT